MDKISGFQITGLSLRGFKSFSEETNLTFGSPTAITGGNGRGKSSIADAIAFAITGQPFFGERKIDRLHSDSNPDLFVQLRFVDEYNAPHTLTRTRQKDRMTITYDGYELRQKYLWDMFGEKEVFLSIFNPLYFIEELGDEGKNLLARYLPRVAPAEVLAQLSPDVCAALQGEKMTAPTGRLKQLREEVRELESSITYLQGKRDLADSQKDNSQKETEALAQRISALKQEAEQLEARRFENIDVFQLQEELADLSVRYSECGSSSDRSALRALDDQLLRLHKKLNERQAEQYASKYAQPIAETSAKVNVLLTEYQNRVRQCKELAAARSCPTCLRPIAEADIPTIQAGFRENVSGIVAEGQVQRTQLAELKALEQKAQDVFEQFKAEDLSKLSAELQEATQKRESAAQTAAAEAEAGQQQANDIRARMQSITAILEYGTLSQTEYDRLRECREEVAQLEAEVSALQKSAPASPENFEAQIKAVEEKIKEHRKLISNIALFISKQAELAFAALQMNRVSISLYDVVKSTGEVKDTFRFTYNGRRYDRLSLSEKIRAGMEVSELFKRLTGRNYPVFVDNMESVDDLNNVKPTGQVIMAKCVRNAELNIRSLSPIQERQKAA